MSDWKLPNTYVFEGHSVRYGVMGDGPALVIVHGTPWSSFNMRHLISALSQNFMSSHLRVILLSKSAPIC